MMKAAAEAPMQTQITPGNAGTRQAQRGRMGADQLMADFEGLLAKQSMIRELPLEKTAKPAPDGESAQPALTSPEVLFLALAGGGEFMAQEETAEQPHAPDSAVDDTSPPISDDNTPPAGPELPAVQMQPQIVQPQAPAAMKEGKQPANDKPSLIPKTAAVAAPSVRIEHSDGEPAVDPAQEVPAPDNVRATERGSTSSSAERKTYAIAGEAASLKDMETSPGLEPVTLIRVAGQETHFAPTPVFLFDDHKIDMSAVNMPAGPDQPSRVQPAPSPIALKAPVGPLKTLTVQLGSHELGLINATMALKDKALDLRIGAMRDDAVASLRENAGRLSDTLQSLGFAVDGVTVQKMHQSDTGAQTSNGHSMQHGAGGQDGTGQGQQRDLNGSGFSAGGSARQSRHNSHDDHLAEQDGNDQVKSAGGTRNSRDVFL